MSKPFETISNLVRYSDQGVNLTFSSNVSYSVDGTVKKVYPVFESPKFTACEDHLDACTQLYRDTVSIDGIYYCREIAFDEKNVSALRIRLTVENQTEKSISLDKMTLVELQEVSSLFPETDSLDWVVYRQGRMKNDLPAVCRLGDQGAAFTDAVAKLRETGGMDRTQEAARKIISDDVTILCAGADRKECVLLGYITGADQLFETVLNLDAEHHCTGITSASVYDAELPAGASAKSEWLRIDCSRDALKALDHFAEDTARIGNVKKRATPPSVFCTWYYYGLSVTEEDMMSDMVRLHQRKIPFEVFQLDEGWEIVLGDWRLNNKFKMTHTEIAQTMREHGFIPGIWTSPFIAHETAPVAIEHPEWMLCHADGSYCLFPMNGLVYRILDITNPDVVQWVEDLYTYLRECGFRYHKLDFTRAPVVDNQAVFFDPTMPRARAYRRAIEAVRRGIGDDAYLLICGGLYDAVIGLVDGQRAGSDVLSMWNDPFGRGGKAAPFTIKQAVLRSWMNAWWDNDPDALMIRRRSAPERDLALTYGLLNEEETKTSVLNQYFGGGLVCSTEPMNQIDDDRLYALRHILPLVPVKTVARDMLKGNRYPSVIDTKVLKGGYHTVSVINWDDEKTVVPELYLDNAFVGDLEEGKTYRVCEFFSGMVTENFGKGDKIPAPAIQPHGSVLFKVEEMSNLPSVVASTAHFSFGGELKRLEIVDKVLHFETTYEFDCPARYTIALPKNLHCMKLPENCAVFGGKLEIYLPGRGEYQVHVPLEELKPLVSLK